MRMCSIAILVSSSNRIPLQDGHGSKRTEAGADLKQMFDLNPRTYKKKQTRTSESNRQIWKKSPII